MPKREVTKSPKKRERCRHCNALLDDLRHCSAECDDSTCQCCGGMLDPEYHCSEGCSAACPYCGASSNAGGDQCRHHVTCSEWDEPLPGAPTQDDFQSLCHAMSECDLSDFSSVDQAEFDKKASRAAPDSRRQIEEMAEHYENDVCSEDHVERIVEWLTHQRVGIEMGSWACDAGMGAGSGYDIFCKKGEAGWTAAQALMEKLAKEVASLTSLYEEYSGGPDPEEAGE